MIETSVPPEVAREIWNARDMRWVHFLLALVLALIAFTLGRIAESDHALSEARQLMAERQPHLIEEAKTVARRETMEWFEKTWACKGFDIDRACNLRERKP